MAVDVDRGVMKFAALGDMPLACDPGQLGWRSEQPQQAERNGHDGGHGNETGNLVLEWRHKVPLPAISESQR